MRHRLFNAAIVCLGLASSGAQAQSWLVNPEEMLASANAPSFEPKDTPTPDAPRIALLAPSLSASVNSPTPIRMRFEASAPAVIRPETFRVRYGALRLDITDRITAVAKVGGQGIDVDEVRLPSGSHKLVVQIADSLGRAAEQSFQFTVRDP